MRQSAQRSFSFALRNSLTVEEFPRDFVAFADDTVSFSENGEGSAL